MRVRTLGVAVASAAIVTTTGAVATFAGSGPASAATIGSTVARALQTTQLNDAVPGLGTLKSLGSTATSQLMRVGVEIPGNTAAINEAYKAIITKGSADYHQYLTPSQFAADFAPSSAVSTAVLAKLQADGLHAVYVSKDGTYAELAGTVGQVERTFNVAIRNYSAAGKTWFANVQGATVPSAVSAVLGLTNLDNITTAADQDTCLESVCTGVVGPSALWSAYDMPNSGVASGDLGQGQKIAIFGEGDTTQVIKDLRQYEADPEFNNEAADVKPVLPQVPVRTVLVADDQSDTSGLGEWDLDTQSSTGMSPDLSELDLYFGEDLTAASIAATYSDWVNDPAGPAIGNSSFGGCEPLEGLAGEEATDDALLEQAAMEGRTMFTSTGDTGSGGCVLEVDLNGLGNGVVPATEYPSASPYVVAVGGTVLYTAATDGTQVQPATRALEYAWTFGGGGSADFEPQPADQAALGGSPAIQPCVGDDTGTPVTSLTTCRAVPDVAAMSGDSLTNGYGIISNGAETETGGTSLSSPLWAGMWARVLAAHSTGCSVFGSTNLGFAQPLLYDVAEASSASDAASFFDVGGTTDSLPLGNGAYTALPRSPLDPTGYDLVSGLGTPDLTGLTKALDCGNITPTS